MNVSLTSELDEFVQSKVQSGMYSSASEVVQEGLRLLKYKDEASADRLERLRAEIEIGAKQIENGQSTLYDSEGLKNLAAKIKAEGRAILAARRKP